MTSADRNDLMPAQEKLEWVTPKISLMGAGETDGSKNYNSKKHQSPTAVCFYLQHTLTVPLVHPN
jgi:hypothetical protein